MTFNFTIPGFNDPFLIEPGSSIIFVGANGGGKTRLAVQIESALGLRAHRISAHRALILNTEVPKISERKALSGLRTGYIQEELQPLHRQGQRWGNNMATALLNDFDFLVQALFAEQANTSLKTHQAVRGGRSEPANPTRFEQLVGIWERLLPHRRLHVSGDDVKVSVNGAAASYKASDMSDGERAIFYMIGQTLVVSPHSLLIVDEPELHVHRSIMSKLWDELEAVRPDCAFVFITHDLEFAAARIAQKFVIREYNPAPLWTIEAVPDATGFDEEVTTLILGSRRPILFVEGNESSLDRAIYRCCYPEWTVIPRGSCEAVIHSVVTMRKNSSLTRVTCSGLVDADDYDSSDVSFLLGLGVATLPVSEIENIILLPEVSRAIAEHEGFSGAELVAVLETLKSAIFNKAMQEGAVRAVVMRYCRRRIDRVLKKIDLSNANGVAEIAAHYTRQTDALDVLAIVEAETERINLALHTGDLRGLLGHYDDKSLVALAATHLKKARKSDFESWLTRVLKGNQAPAVAAAIRNQLPSLQAQ